MVTAVETDGAVRLRDRAGPAAPAPGAPRSRAIGVIPPELPWLHGVALSPEGRHLAVCNPDGTVYLLRLAGRGALPEAPAGGGK
jgi:hypothetical protein